MALLHLDCPHGLGGDMFLCSLAALGLDLAPLARIFQDGPGLLRGLRVVTETRGGLAGQRLELDLEQDAPLRRLPDILEILDNLDLGDGVRQASAQAMRRLAEVEAKVHGIAPEAVHFHEVGAADTVVDVVGAFWGLEELNVTRVTCSALPWFEGEVHCAHGRLPLPAPATLELMRGKPLRPPAANAPRRELITPTGALILDQIVDAFDEQPRGRLLQTALAYGSAPDGGGLRSLLLDDTGETVAPAQSTIEHVWQLESNLDHLSGEDLGHCFEALFEAGALDVAWTPSVMKKGRPGGTLQALCSDESLARVQEAFFRSSLTLGLRRSRVERVALPREASTLQSPHGCVQAKATHFGEERWSAPEYDALNAIAKKAGVSTALLRRLLSGEEEGL